MISWEHLQKALKQKWTTNLYNLSKKMAGTLPLADPLKIFWQDFHTWQSLWNFSFLKVLSFNFVCISKAEFSKTYCLLGMNQNLSWACLLGAPLGSITSQMSSHHTIWTVKNGIGTCLIRIWEDWLVQFKQCGDPETSVPCFPAFLPIHLPVSCPALFFCLVRFWVMSYTNNVKKSPFQMNYSFTHSN